MASSSSNIDLQKKKYDVFISFYGEDVRYNFLSHLFKALTHKQINAFKDENLERGEVISEELLSLIKESHISLVIFSENYPKSTWCLDELAQIFDCFKKEKQIVVPVFRHVDPSLVQNLDGNFKDELVEHGKKFHDKVEIWSCALKEISCISGFVLSRTESEAELIEKIADDVNEKLSRLQSSDPQHDGFFGIDLHVREVESLLCIELTDQVRMVEIWGMGGIGKTTIADEVFNKIKKNFDACCFVPSVRETLEKRAPNDLQDEIFRKLLEEKDLYIGTPYSLQTSVKRKLQCKKVLIVFDDVIDSNQLMSVLADEGLYSPGSRIMVTSRDSQVLKNVEAKRDIYLVKGLNDSEALKLFSRHAFHKNHPKEEYMKLSKEAIEYADGVPLALIVLGSNLYNKSMEEWKEELEKVKNIPDKDIQKILRISYDGLERNDKVIFLDIACFLKGQSNLLVKEALKSFRSFTEIGINRLHAKSLITSGHFHTITMHDLLEQMGKEIVIEESNNTLGEQSRLWKSEDVIHVLRNDLGTVKVEVISLNMKEMDEKVEISSSAFMKMHNLRFLKISFYISDLPEFNGGLFLLTHLKTNALLPDGLDFLPGSLRYFWWDKYPLSSLPSNFCAENLIELHMPCSQLKELWNVEKSFKNLKFVDLRESRNLIIIPDFSFSKCPNLEVLELEGCSSLVEISWSCRARSSNTSLDLHGCTSLCHLLEIPCNITHIDLTGTAIKQLLPNIGFVMDLWILNVSSCVDLQQLPKNLGNLRNLEILDACKSGLQELPDSINQLKELKILNCSECKGLKLPPLNGLINLVIIDLSYCEMSEFPNGLCSLTSLEEMNLSGNNFKSIPDSINELSRLWNLDLRDCIKLEYLPELPTRLSELNATNCTSLESVSTTVLPQWLVLRDCIKLNQESWNTTINDVLEQHLFYDNKLDEDYYCKLCIAGSEVPQRMKYKNNNGSSLSVTLDCHDLIGFSLCAVVAHLHPPRDLTYIRCRVFLLPNTENISFNLTSFYYPLIQVTQSENMFLWYSHTYLNESKVSFEFEAVYDEIIEYGSPIIKCGFSPVYRK